MVDATLYNPPRWLKPVSLAFWALPIGVLVAEQIRVLYFPFWILFALLIIGQSLSILSFPRPGITKRRVAITFVLSVAVGIVLTICAWNVGRT
jgi:hypothetical protein